MSKKEFDLDKEIEKFKKGVKFLGLPHKYPMPDEWK